MKENARPTSWIHRLRKLPSPQLSDWGDQGTAFGLEMAQVPYSHGLEAPAKAQPAPRHSVSRWWSRRR